MTGIINKYLLQGNPRSILVKKNILGSLFVKGVSISISLVMVPLTISYVNPSRYGIWLALSSVVGWVSFFDIGFTCGLRNKFAEARAKGDIQLARAYLSTAYVFMSAIFGSLLVILLAANLFIDWGALLNIGNVVEEQVGVVAAVVITYFCCLFVLRIVNTLLTADQKPAISSLVDMLGQLASLAAIFVLTRTVRGSLMNLTIALCLPTLVVLLLAQVYLYRSEYSAYAPSFRLARKDQAKEIMGLGVKFFIPYVAFIVQYQTTSFLIAHFFGVTEVTVYNIAYKYFNVLQMTFTIVTAPLWSSVTDSYNKGDEDWIKRAVNKYLYVLSAFVTMALLMLLCSDKVYELWIGTKQVHIGFDISLLCCLFVITGMFANIFVSVINGIGALKIQFVSSLITPALFIVMSLFFVLKLGTGMEGILISSIISNCFGVIIAPIQYYKIFVNKSPAKVWYA